MFIINIIFTKDLTEIEPLVAAHRSFLDEYYQQGYFLVSGPKDPRTGGIIVAITDDEVKLNIILKQDPYYIHGVARYEMTRFKPVKYHPQIKSLINL